MTTTSVSKNIGEACLAAALNYAVNGLLVVPLYPIINGVCSCRNGRKCRSPGKHPWLQEWQNQATNDSTTILDWWKQKPLSGVGIVMSEGLWALDIDPGRMGDDSLGILVGETDGRIMDTWSVRTGSGGQHLYFQSPGFHVKTNSDTFEGYPGLDTRGGSSSGGLGLVVAPPTLHISGRQYEWLDDTGPGRTELSPTPSVLAELLREANGQGKQQPSTKQPDRISHPNRHKALRNLAFRMRKTGADAETIFHALTIFYKRQCTHDPPKTETDLRRLAEGTIERIEMDEFEDGPIEPIQVDRQPFPVGALPPIVSDYVKECAETVGISPEIYALPCLAAVAGAIGSTIRLRVTPDYSVFPTLWAVVIQESGGMKSDGIRRAMQPIFRRESELRDEWNKAMQAYEMTELEYQHAMTRYKKAGQNEHAEIPEKPNRPKEPHLFIESTTIEALHRVLMEKEGRGILLVRDELSGWFKAMNQYRSHRGGEDQAFFLSRFDGDAPSKATRVSEDTRFIASGTISVVGTIQPKVLLSCVNADDGESVESGILARFLLAWPEKIVPPLTGKRIATGIQEQYTQLLYKLFQYDRINTDNCDCRIIAMTTEGENEFYRWYNDKFRPLREKADSPVTAALGKLAPGYAGRLALIDHFVCMATDPQILLDQPVALESVRRSIRLIEWFTKETERIYTICATDLRRGGANTAGDYSDIIDFVRQSDNRYVTARDVRTRFRRRFDSTGKVRQTLDSLVSRGLLLAGAVKKEGPGRNPSVAYFLPGRIPEGLET